MTILQLPTQIKLKFLLVFTLNNLWNYGLHSERIRFELYQIFWKNGVKNVHWSQYFEPSRFQFLKSNANYWKENLLGCLVFST